MARLRPAGHRQIGRAFEAWLRVEHADQLRRPRSDATRPVLRRSPRAVRLLQAKPRAQRRAPARLRPVRVHDARAQGDSVKEVVIFGAGDQAQVAFVCLTEYSPHKVAAFTVNRSYIKEGAELLGRPVVAFEDLEKTHPPDRFAMLVSVGFKRVNELRTELYQQCQAKGYELISYV